MTNDLSGWLWLVIDVGFVVVLGAVLAYGIIQVRRMSERKRRQRDQATRGPVRPPSLAGSAHYCLIF